LKGITVIALSVILIGLGQQIAYSLVSGAMLFFNVKFDVPGFVFWLRAMPYIGFFCLQLPGAMLLAYFLIRSKCRLDMPRVRKQLLKVTIVSAVVLMVFGSVFLSEPAVHAEWMATTNYYLETPLPIADMYIGHYTNNSYFVINGTNWDNFAVSPNSTLIETYALGNVTAGTVYLKEARHDYNLTVPTHVTVIESYNGVERRFGNPSDPQGSPYTISVDNSQVEYYLAEDSRNIIRWISRDAGIVTNQTAYALRSIGGTVKFSGGNFSFSTSTKYYTQTTFVGDGENTTILSQAANVTMFSNAEPSARYNTWKLLTIASNRAHTGHAIEMYGDGRMFVIDHVTLSHFLNSALYLNRIVGLDFYASYIRFSGNEANSEAGMVIDGTTVDGMSTFIDINSGLFEPNYFADIDIKCKIDGLWIQNTWFEQDWVPPNYIALEPTLTHILFSCPSKINSSTNVHIVNNYVRQYVGSSANFIYMPNSQLVSSEIVGNTLIFPGGGTSSAKGVIWLNQTEQVSISHNTIQAHAANGETIVITDNAGRTTISDNPIINGQIVIMNTVNGVQISGNNINLESALNYSIIINSTYIHVVASLMIDGNSIKNGGITINSADCPEVSSNIFVSCAYGVTFASARVIDGTIEDNNLLGATTKITDSGTRSRFYRNDGYNQGLIANAWDSNNGGELRDSPKYAWSIRNNTLMTNWQSPKTAYIVGGTVSAVQVNGETVFSTTNVMVILQPGDTFKIVYSVTPDIKFFKLS
jgi:hypothetical protein